MNDNPPQAQSEVDDQNQLWVVTAESGAVRDGGRKVRKFSPEELSVNINLFLDHMGKTLEKTPDKVGKFQLAEFEVHAEINAKGALTLMGTGGEAGASGGIKFVFKRSGNET